MKNVVFAFFLGAIAGVGVCRGDNDSSQMRFENALLHLFKGDLGCTLVGTKPVSISWCEEYDFSHDSVVTDRVFAFLRQTFAHSDAFFLNIVSLHPRLAEIQFIHTQSLSELMAKEPVVRRCIQRRFGSCEQFFVALRNSQKSLLDLMERNSIVLGLMFGYGKNNTEFHARYDSIGWYLQKHPRVRLLPFSYKPHFLSIRSALRRTSRFRFERPAVQPQPLFPFTSLEEEWKRIFQVILSHRSQATNPTPYLFCLPYYMEGAGGDSAEVRRRFSRARDRLARLFCGKIPSEVLARQAAPQHAQTQGIAAI